MVGEWMVHCVTPFAVSLEGDGAGGKLAGLQHSESHLQQHVTTFLPSPPLPLPTYTYTLQDILYLRPYIKQVQKEMKEKKTWDRL